MIARLYYIAFFSCLFFGFACSSSGPTPSPTVGVYTCSMHPQVRSSHAGNCPICHMTLVKLSNENPLEDTSDVKNKLAENSTSISWVVLERADFQGYVDAWASVEYNTQQIGSIAANVSGRIEKLYIKYPFQKVYKGQKILEIYSPELAMAQENLWFLMKHDSNNQELIEAAILKIKLLGITDAQLAVMMKEKKTNSSIPVYSPISGMVKDLATPIMGIESKLSVREGMYLKKGQSIFGVYTVSDTWAAISVYNTNLGKVTKGTKVFLSSDAYPNEEIASEVYFVEPFFREGSKTATVRARFDNAKWHLPIGSNLKARVSFSLNEGNWLPKSAVLSLGNQQIVFVKRNQGFEAKYVQIGIHTADKIQIVSGILSRDSVAAVASYFLDNEAFVKPINSKSDE